MDQQLYVGQRTPSQCRNGPVTNRQCHDFTCFTAYLILIGSVVFFSIFHASGAKMTPMEIQKNLTQLQFSRPLLAIFQTTVPIVMALVVVAILCTIILITSFLIPAIVVYLFLPLSMLIMIVAGIFFIVRYFGIFFPLISIELQNNFAKDGSIFTLIIGLTFILSLIISAIVVYVKRQRFTYMIYILRIAQEAFWSNLYLFIFSFIFTILSMLALAGNVFLLSICFTRKSLIISPIFTSVLIIIEALWTHGLLQALSDFFFQSISIYWYHKKRREFMKKSWWCDSIFLTFKLIGTHIGTISFGSILTYNPEILNTILGKVQKNYPLVYYTTCILHSCTFRKLTRYCYFQTILQSLNFCDSNVQMFGLRRRTREMLPKLYMLGNFYSTLAKIFSIVCGMIFCYFFIAKSQDFSHIFNDRSNIIGPLVITFLGTLEINNHFLNATGLVGDTLVFAYSADVEIQKKYYGIMQPYNCPDQIRDIIYQFKAGKQYIYDK